MPLFTRNGIELSGEIGAIRISIEGDDSGDDRLYSAANEMRLALAREASGLTRKYLGDEFQLLDVRIERGSLIITIVIGVVATFYMGFSRYENFVKSVNLLTSQLTTLMRQYFGDRRLAPERFSVVGYWEPGASLLRASRPTSDSDTNQFLLMYLVISHATLMALVMWLLLHRLV